VIGTATSGWLGTASRVLASKLLLAAGRKRSTAAVQASGRLPDTYAAACMFDALSLTEEAHSHL